MGLSEYRKKRDFKKTPEPKGGEAKGERAALFVIQKHYARRLHYDFRLKVGRKLVSWAVPKGLSKKAGEKRLAVHTEDHPLSYADFEGEIPEGEYGAGKVLIWDKGTYTNQKKEAMSTCVKKGRIEIRLEGKKYKGDYVLFHFKEKNWLIIKRKHAR